MQHLKSDLIHSIALALRDYPDGISKELSSTHLQLEKKKVIFFSVNECSQAGMELMTGALQKGLKLKNQHYQIIIGEFELNKFLSNIENDIQTLIVQFGDSNKDFSSILITDSADTLANDREKKKIFWEQLQSICY